MDNHSDILKRNGLSVTESRKKILELFLDTAGAMAHADIEKNTAAAFDRVTVYRTLQTFVEKGIIQDGKKDVFLQNFKSADDFACLFVVVPEGANFVYYPYQR